MLALFSEVFAVKKEGKILVFSKTTGFRHKSIGAGIEALKKMGKEKGFEVDFTEDSEKFTTDNLKKYKAVVFLNTTGDVLNNEQQKAFEGFIRSGNGYVGVHSASDTEYDWPWYGDLVGAYFLDHPNHPSNVLKAKFMVLLKNHWATKGMPDTFEHTDEFYNFKDIKKHIKPIIAIDETTYPGGKNPDFHPMSWYHEYDGGRAFYTALGHTDESYSDTLFLNHLWAGVKYAAKL